MKNYILKKEDKFPEKCLVVRLTNDVNNKKLKGKKISFCNLPDGKYNLRLDNNRKSQTIPNMIKLGLMRKLLKYYNNNEIYVSSANRRNN